MAKSTFFTGQPPQRAARMAGTAQNHRFHNGDAVLQPGFQGCRQGPENWKEERRHKGPYCHHREPSPDPCAAQP